MSRVPLLFHCHITLCFSFTDAVVGLEEGPQRVYDDVGVVQLCAVVTRPNINCPITFAFSVVIRTADGSAGIYEGPNWPKSHFDMFSSITYI